VWLNNAKLEALQAMLKHSSAMLMASTPDGKILWANEAFCEWSQYTLAELMNMTWKQISVDDGDLAADIAMVSTLDEYSLSYTVQKRYIPKGSKPQIGNLHVTKYPARGPIEFCFCHWTPLTNGTAQAFELALNSNKIIADSMAELTNQIKTLTSQSEEQRFTLSLVAMIARHPRVAFTMLVVMLSLSGFDVVLSTLQRLGYVKAPPVVIQPEQ
jgi:PAS domain S-box-containing protein